MVKRQAYLLRGLWAGGGELAAFDPHPNPDKSEAGLRQEGRKTANGGRIQYVF